MANYYQSFRYGSAEGSVTPGATPQDILTISGNDETIVYVTAIGFSAIQTTEGINLFSILKRSTANTGGTSTLIASTPYNSSYPSAQAVIRTYTANPTLGELAGNLWAGWVDCPEVVPGETSGSFSGVSIFFPQDSGGPIALLNSNELLALNMGGQALPPGLEVVSWIQWYEVYK